MPTSPPILFGQTHFPVCSQLFEAANSRKCMMLWTSKRQ